MRQHLLQYILHHQHAAAIPPLHSPVSTRGTTSTQPLRAVLCLRADATRHTAAGGPTSPSARSPAPARQPEPGRCLIMLKRLEAAMADHAIASSAQRAPGSWCEVHLVDASESRARLRDAHDAHHPPPTQPLTALRTALLLSPPHSPPIPGPARRVSPGKQPPGIT
jgi:hypothetical protein